MTAATNSPILLVPYQWIGDFVRCHSVVQLLKRRFPERPVDILSSTLAAPLAAYMPGVRKAVVHDLPRGRLGYGENARLAEKLAPERYGTALVMSRKWKAALAPYLAGIPERVGFLGEMRFVLLSDIRPGEKNYPTMAEQCAALALPRGAALPPLPEPKLAASAAQVKSWRERTRLEKNGQRVVALAPGSVWSSKRWPTAHYARLAVLLRERGHEVWITGGRDEEPLAEEIRATASAVYDLTDLALGDGALALGQADCAVTNDSGALHMAAAFGTPTLALFGPTDPAAWMPLNPSAKALLADEPLDCRPCAKHDCPLGHHKCLVDLSPQTVFAAVERALAHSRS
ncbi:MAG TPA: lipopolysaccharide heptosyltransferase II [Xanthobacteraceae bacterium]|nr:lipopolysaccharide heptosyltransferase II [Xanthobacteraceae bacterium]